MNLTYNQIKQLVQKYPYIVPHNVWTGNVIDNYDYTFTEACNLPAGWHRLFFLLCKDLRPILEKSNIIDKFYFTQVKEKYGTMRTYSSLSDSSHIIDIYESYSKHVCQQCGELSKYYTTGYISYLCDNCVEHYKDNCKKIKHSNVINFEIYDSYGHYKLRYSYRPLHRKYNKVKNMTDEEFFNFLMED